NIVTVGRPRRVMVVLSGLGHIDSMRIASVTVCQEYRISPSGFMKRDSGSVRGPGRSYGFRKEWSGGAAQRGFHPGFVLVVLCIVSSEPDLSSIRRETDTVDGFVVQIDRIDPHSHVSEHPAADLGEPGIENSFLVRKEHGELSIRRDRSIEFVTFEVGQ